MKAAVLRGVNDLRVEDIPLPKMNPQSILIKVKACSICGSDLRILQSGNRRVQYPAVIGHEISGEIVEVGSRVTGFKRGNRLAVGADVPCGLCVWCVEGNGNLCEKNYAIGYQFPGGFAQYCLLKKIVVKYGPLVTIPPEMSFEEGALAEPLACCLNGLESVFFSKGKSVLIIGAGAIGIFLLLAARFLGASHIFLADNDTARLSNAEKFPADAFIDTSREDLKSRILKKTKTRGVDVVFTACPSLEAQEEAIALVAKHGFINFFGGLPANEKNIAVSSNSIHYREIYLTGSHGSSPRHHREAVRLIAKGKIDAASLITHRFPLEKIHEAFELVKNREGLKVIITN